MSIDRVHDHDCACDCCGLALSEDDYEHQERLRIDFRAGYASVFGDGNTVRAVLCQHCVQKHLGPWLTIIAESEGADAPPTSSPRHAYQSYQFKERGAEHATEASSVRHEQQAGWLGRAYQKLWNIP